MIEAERVPAERPIGGSEGSFLITSQPERKEVNSVVLTVDFSGANSLTFFA